jgi:transglutaminase-like putative cysteine protease
MLYDISLRITYRYEHPANAGRHLLRVMPADLPGEQRRLSGTLDVSPTCGQQLGFRDFFGNEVMRLSLASAHDALGDVVARELTLAGTSPHHFVIPSARVPESAMLRDFAQACIPENVTTLRAVHALGEALHEELIFDADATTVDTPAEEAFIARRGVCQDFAHIMIGCLRGVGVPAGYVSGFLRTEPPPGCARLDGADAMHAWVRAWCGPTLGWVEYDPTNGVQVRDDHVVVARGRDYSDVAPVRGVLRTAGTQRSIHLVDMVPLPDPVDDERQP